MSWPCNASTTGFNICLWPNMGQNLKVWLCSGRSRAEQVGGSVLPLLVCPPPAGERAGEELPLLAAAGLAPQHRDVRPLQDHHALPHRLGLLRHHGAEGQAPPVGPGADGLAPAVHRLARARLPGIRTGIPL